MNIEKITQELFEAKQLVVDNSYIKQLGHGNLIFAKDNTQEYTIKIISVSSEDDPDSVCQSKVVDASNYAYNLSRCDHKNILKYIDQYQIGTNFYILMEKCEISLSKWVEQNGENKIDRDTFIDFSLGILNAAQCIQSRNLLVGNSLNLNSIYLDKNMEIKLQDFSYYEKINPFAQTEKFFSQKSNKHLFYLPPEFIDLKKNADKEKKVFYSMDGDVWVVGICLYVLAGAEFLHIKRLTKGQQFFQFQQKIDIDINQIILTMLQQYPLGRPSLYQIIDSFQNLKNDQEFNQDFSDLVNKGRECYNNEEFLESIDYLQQALEINPHSYKVMNYIGESYSEINNKDEAISYFLKTIQRNPQFYKAYNNLGKQYYEKGMIDEAIIYFKQSVDIYPQNSFAYNYLGNSYRDKEMYYEAISYFTKAYEVNPHFYFAYFNIGMTFYVQSMYDEAIFWLNKVIQYQPFNTEVLYFIGISYDSKSMFDEAEEYYKKALEIDPNDVKLLNILGRTYTHQQKDEKAIKYFKQAIQIDQRCAVAYRGLGNLYYDNENKYLPIQYYKKAKQICKHNDTVIFNLGMMYSKIGMLENCQKYIRKAIQMSPDQHYFDSLNEIKSKM